MENYQNKDGSIRVPAALQLYLNGLDTIRAQ
jgi:seryl-tRNA synthetase